SASTRWACWLPSATTIRKSTTSSRRARPGSTGTRPRPSWLPCCACNRCSCAWAATACTSTATRPSPATSPAAAAWRPSGTTAASPSLTSGSTGPAASACASRPAPARGRNWSSRAGFKRDGKPARRPGLAPAVLPDRLVGPALPVIWPAPGQELLLGRRRLPTEDGVAVGKAPEASDDVAVLAGVVEHALRQRPPGRLALLQQPLVLLHRDVLQVRILGMLQGQVEKPALHRAQHLVQVLLDAVQAQPLRRGILGEGLRPAAVDVAGELIQQDDQGQAAAGGLLPAAQLAGHSLLVQAAEAIADLGVEGGIGLEPARH